MTAPRERLDALGWVRSEPPRSSYDSALFGVVTALVEDGERLQDELALLRAELRVLDQIVAGEVAS